ncbi:MAG: patatin-like phospholipase family protein [Alphaproteobacteria bacterium]
MAKPVTPTIGLALGGGAARGWAHIGVMQALKEAGIFPDVVAGASIGAFVGGCDIAGQLGALEKFALSLTRRRVFTFLDLAFGGGLIRGNRLAELLETHVADIKIENLKRRFVAIATELDTGHEIWLRSGDLANAMRASYALPGVFKPVEHEGRLLIDGALVNPVPTSACRAYGARLVIAVNLNQDIFGRGMAPRNSRNGNGGEPAPTGTMAALKQQIFGAKESDPSLLAVLVGAFNISMDRIARARLAGDPPDITIAPKVGHIGLFDFERAEEMIALGREATEQMLPQFHEMQTLLG